jgi:hypothetical protein
MSGAYSESDDDQYADDTLVNEDSTAAEDAPRGSWEGSSDVTSADINWLYASRRIPPELACRLPGDEVEPAPEEGERVVFLAHSQRGFGLPVSDFFSQFMVRFSLQPHQIQPNAILHLSRLVSLAEGYLGLWPTVDLWAKYFQIRAVTLPAPVGTPQQERELVQCGAAAIQARRASKLTKVFGLDTCKKW